MVAQAKVKPGQDNLAQIFLEGVAIDLNVHYWRGQRVLQASDLRLSSDQVPKFMSLGRKLIVPKASITRFKSFENAATYMMDGVTFKMPVGGGRFVPNAALPEVLDRLEKIQRDFNLEVDHFLDNYSHYQGEMLAEFQEYRYALEFAYPDPSVLRGKFSFDFNLFQVTLPAEARSQTMTSLEARDRARVSKEFQTKLNSKVNNWLVEVGTQLRQETVRVVSQLSSAVQSGKLHPASVSALQQWCDRFAQLNFMNDREVARALNEIRGQLSSSGAAGINSDEQARGALQVSIQDALKVARDLGSVEHLAGNYRQIELG